MNPPFPALEPVHQGAQFEPRRAGIVLLMVAFSIMSYFDRIIMSIAGPLVMREMRLSETQMGVIYSAFTFSYGILMIPGGRLADRFGPRRVLTVMGLGAAAFTGLTALGGCPLLGAWLGVFPSLLAIRLSLGVVTAPLYPSCAIMNARWTPPRRRARVWGWVASGTGIGGALAPLLFAWMTAQYGWRKSFVISALVTGALSAIWYFYTRDFPHAPQTPAAIAPKLRVRWREMFRQHLILLTVSYLTTNYFEYIFFYWLYYYFVQIRHASSRESAISSAVIWTAWAIMTPVGGWISDRLADRLGVKKGRRLVPVLGLTAAGILLIVAINVTAPVPMVILLFLTLGLAATTDGPYWVSAGDLGGENVGVASGILNTGGNVGGFLAPIVTPLVAARFGWSWALYAGSFVVVAGAVLWFFIDVARFRPREGHATA
jgi:ACS family glucarate transporter-like MFS transporter